MMACSKYTFVVIWLVSATMLSGCVTGSTESFFAIDDVPATQTGASKAGVYPEINDVPVGETTQLSAAQTASEKAALARAVSKGRTQAAGNNQANYNQEVARLRRLAQEQQQRRAAALKAASQ